MSWVLGFIGNPPVNRLNQFASIHAEPLHRIQTKTIFLAAGGHKRTCLCGSLSSSPKPSQKGWVVLGLGIVRHNEYCALLSTQDWQTILSSPLPQLQELDGHFVVIRWEPDRIECFTDQLGLRTLYLARMGSGVAFSTRLDWLARLTERSEIDFETFGSRWLTFNQLSSESPIRGIQRLGAGGIAKCTPTRIRLENKPWIPEFSRDSPQSLTSILRALIRPRAEAVDSMSLGLSGGLDSRVLLALMLSSGDRNFSLHTFGDPDDPDVYISENVAESQGLMRVYLNEPIPSANVCISMLREYVGQTGVIEPASAILKLRYYPRLNAQGKLMIDGGFGEIGRRQYFNRLLKRGKKAIRLANAALVFPYFQTPRAFIFRQDIFNMMRRGTERQIEIMLSKMPSLNDIGAENYFDLFAVRTRFPQYGAPEQARLDGQIQNYMPFAQPSYLQAMFNIPVEERRNGKAYRSIIREQCPALAKLPLVKNGTTYPFSFATVSAWLWTKAKSKVGIGFADPSAVELLSRVSEFVQDTVHSREVSSWEPYDYTAIVRMVEEFYEGKTELARQVDWWLAFEMWRKSISSDD